MEEYSTKKKYDIDHFLNTLHLPVKDGRESSYARRSRLHRRSKEILGRHENCIGKIACDYFMVNSLEGPFVSSFEKAIIPSDEKTLNSKGKVKYVSAKTGLRGDIESVVGKLYEKFRDAIELFLFERIVEASTKISVGKESDIVKTLEGLGSPLFKECSIDSLPWSSLLMSTDFYKKIIVKRSTLNRMENRKLFFPYKSDEKNNLSEVCYGYHGLFEGFEVYSSNSGFGRGLVDAALIITSTVGFLQEMESVLAPEFFKVVEGETTISCSIPVTYLLHDCPPLLIRESISGYLSKKVL